MRAWQRTPKALKLVAALPALLGLAAAAVQLLSCILAGVTYAHDRITDANHVQSCGRLFAWLSMRARSVRAPAI